MDNNLKDPFAFTNSAKENEQKELRRLKSDIALGKVRKTNKRYENRKKLLKGLAVILAFSSLVIAYDISKNKAIEEKNLTEKVVSYTPTSGADVKYYDSFGNEVELTPKELIKNAIDDLYSENSMKR